MSFPFSYTGVMSAFNGDSLEAVFEKLSMAVREAGGEDIRRIGDTIEFRGIVRRMSSLPLTNVDRGRISIDDRDARPTLTYTITIELWGLVVPLAAMLASLILVAAGVPDFGVFAVFGAAGVVAFCVNSLVIRVRFPRWLRKVLATA